MSIKEIRSLLYSLKQFHKEFLEDGLDVTVATNDGRQWNYQTGDNSYTGGAYGLALWSVKTLFKDTHCGKLAAEIVSELKGMAFETRASQKMGIGVTGLN